MGKTLNGTSLVGMSLNRTRVNNDYYATPSGAIKEILNREELIGSILEPACGEGHISKILKEYYPNSEIISTDLVDRGYGTGNIDFLNYDYKRKFNNIITNPPFKFAKEFIEKSLEITTKKVIMFAKIQLLEGQSRKELFKKSPLRTIYVFSKRQVPLRNGSPVNEQGKPWNSTMCFCWFIWEKDYDGKPYIKWI